MGLRGWSWDAQWGPAGLGDRPLLEALQTAIPDETVDAVIEVTGTREQRRRRLPTQLVVTLVVAMGRSTGYPRAARAGTDSRQRPLTVVVYADSISVTIRSIS